MNPERHTPQQRAESRSREELYRAPEPTQPDLRRLEVASRRLSERIANGIVRATEHKDAIDQETARCIANTLGRAFGPHSALAHYARTAEASYEAMREEYMQLYDCAQSPAWLLEQINWLATHIIKAEHPSAETISSNEPYPLTLEEVLVPTAVTVNGLTMTVHVPGCYNSAAIKDLEKELTRLHLDEDVALQAYLSLPNVNAFNNDTSEEFQNTFGGVFDDEEEALRSVCDLGERERDIETYASEKGLYYDYLIPDWQFLREEANSMVDLVEREGHVYVFYK